MIVYLPSGLAFSQTDIKGEGEKKKKLQKEKKINVNIILS